MANGPSKADGTQTISLRLDGEGVAPRTVTMTVLGKLNSALSALVEDIGGSADDLSLVDIRTGSAEYVYAGAARTAAEVGAIIAGAQKLGVEGVPDIGRRGWRLLEEAVPTGLRLSVRHETGDGSVTEAEVRSVLPNSSVGVARGTTTLFGVVRSAILGSRGASVWIEAHGQGRLVVCRVSEPLAIELGRLLGSEVALEGEASWDIDDLTIVQFIGRRLLPYRPGTLASAIRDLAKAVGDRWDGVDVDSEFRERRGQ